MFRAGSPDALLYAWLGAAVMGIWSATSTAAGAALQRERWHGTLELLVAAPAPFALVLLPMTIAMSTIGLYSMAATLLWGRVLFGIHVRVEHWLLFCLAVPATVIAIGMLGFLLAVTFVRYRTAWALGNMVEYPVWLICGFLVPLSLFPGVGAADLVGAGADLGHAGDPRGGDWAGRPCPTCSSASASARCTRRSACSASTGSCGPPARAPPSR